MTSNLTVKINADTSRYVGAIREAARAGHRAAMLRLRPRARRRHLRRCDLCNPAAFPPSLPIDGHAYHRRTRNRSRRR